MRWTHFPMAFPGLPPGWSCALIKMSFTPEEVWLAGQMTRIPETAAEIANRVGRDVAEVTATLESLVPRRLLASTRPGWQLPAWRPRSRARRGTGWARSWLAGTKPLCGCWTRSLPSSSSNS